MHVCMILVVRGYDIFREFLMLLQDQNERTFSAVNVCLWRCAPGVRDNVSLITCNTRHQLQ